MLAAPRKLKMNLLYRGHKSEMPVARPHGLLVEALAGEVEKTGLAGKRQGISPLDHFLALVPFVRPSAVETALGRNQPSRVNEATRTKTGYRMSQSNYTKAKRKDAVLQPPAGTPSPQPALSGKPRSRRWPRFLAIAGALVLMIALLLYGSGVYVVSSMFSQRVEKFEYTPESLGLTAETLNLQSSDGIPLKAWWLPVLEPRGVVVLLHGMEGMDASSLLPHARFLGPAGYACLALDMRAHGRSGGERIALAFEEPRDVSAALNWIQGQPDLRDLPVTLLGISMGGSTAIRTAAARPDVDAVISVSSYDSVDHMIEQGMRLMGAPEWLIPIYSPFIRFGILTVYGVWPAAASPRHDIARIPPRPVLIIHGDADDQVPVEQAHRLVEASGGQAKVWIVAGGSHGVYSTEFEGDQDLKYRQRILTFLQNNVIH